MTVQYIDKDLEVFAETDKVITHTFLDGVTPKDVTLWGIRFTVLNNPSDDTVDAILNDTTVTKEDSGSGTTDTLVYTLTKLNTTLDAGTYFYFYRVIKPGSESILQKGCLTIWESN